MKKNPNVKYAVVGTGNRSINTLGFFDVQNCVQKTTLQHKTRTAGRRMRFFLPAIKIGKRSSIWNFEI